MSSTGEYASDGTTLADVIDRFEKSGFNGQMAAREAGRLMCFSCREEVDACDVTLEALRRTEGASDPDDMAAVAAIVCPRCSTKATVVLKFGPDATPEDADVLKLLDDNRDRSGVDATAAGGKRDAE